jgi:hypothetical protein
VAKPPPCPHTRWMLSHTRINAIRASGLNLVVAAIVLWNTVYLERTIVALSDQGQIISDDLPAHLSPLGWEHINLTGDYIWDSDVTEDLPPSRQLLCHSSTTLKHRVLSVQLCPFRGRTPNETLE